jgi:DNA-damage-inducible protein J
MAKVSAVRARIEPQLKAEAERILSEVGLTPSVAIGILYRRIVAENGFPVPLYLPNAATREALEEARDVSKLQKIESIYDLLGDDIERRAANKPIQKRPAARPQTGRKSRALGLGGSTTRRRAASGPAS